MGLYNKMKTSEKLEAEGIWLRVDDTRILLARAGGKNSKYMAAAEKIARENKRALDLMNESQGRKLFSQLFAEHIVLDWLTKDDNGQLLEDAVPAPEDAPKDDRWTRGISGPTGEIIEFNRANVLQTFSDLPDMLRLVKETAEDPAGYRASILEGITGN